MEEIAISINGLTKTFRKKTGSGKKEDFNALNNISFSINKGDRLGIIGSNGAGKSTLLKIISRILSPTKGSIEIFGRVNSLLEVGTGFDPELSGRENIYLNASILGLSKIETAGLYDEIVNFSGISEFIDLPVKHLSSGMYSRLAFSVATHVPGDILLIDEVLSVGDAVFRRRALEKMKGLIGEKGRTILFVSHSSDAIAKFCNLCIWIDKGSLKMIGGTNEVLGAYIQSTRSFDTAIVNDTSNLLTLNKWIRSEIEEISYQFLEIHISDCNGRSVRLFSWTDDIFIEMKIRVKDAGLPAIKGFHLYCEPRGGVPSETHVCAQIPEEPLPMSDGIYRFRSKIPKHFLATGSYRITPFIVTFAQPLIRHQMLDKLLRFNIIDDDENAMIDGDRHYGVINPIFKWETL